MGTSFAIWIATAVLLWLIGGVIATRRSMPSGIWFLVGSLGLGLCCLFLGMLDRAVPPMGDAFWLRLLWSTILFIVPVWVGFSYRFGRGGMPPAVPMKPALFILWTAAAILLAFGLKHAPLGLSDDRRILFLLPPTGRLVAFHSLGGLVLIVWNLQATLEAARASARRRIELAVYSLVPLAVTAIYLMAEILLYGQQGRGTTRLILPATILSTFGFAAVIGWHRFTDANLAVGRPVIYSSVVLTSLGVLFVALAALAQILRALGVGWATGWQEVAIAAVLILGFAFTIFPGLREGVQRFADHNLFASRFDYRRMWERMNRILATDLARSDLPAALTRLFREMFGPVRVQLWILEKGSGSMRPLEAGSDLPVLGPDHPLLRALRDRDEPLLVAGEAGTIEEVSLHIACEEIAQRRGLRAFVPIHLEKELVGIIGCGSGEGRILHPEDLSLMQMMADHLAGLLAAGGFAGREASAPPGVSPGIAAPPKEHRT